VGDIHGKKEELLLQSDSMHLDQMAPRLAGSGSGGLGVVPLSAMMVEMMVNR
jgi:hypothetical protein